MRDIDFLILLILVTLFAVGCIHFLIKANTKNRVLEIQNEQLQESAKKLIDSVEKIKCEKHKLISIPVFSFDDPEFLKVLADIFSKDEIVFFMEDLKLDVINHIVNSNDKALEENAIGKLKGIELVQKQMSKIIDMANKV